ncbi:ABC transporter ATP-binding protein [Ferviditalea candida]|uniref:ABC transporter ATP-binding protein n=1 Tax=Ferviditalea candida TaxID=3108399 RepID=A0ABU5ZLL6_9BACL|nr:ABC transporter ATP-binding protein [Paenibacillaceae bacterium T2]
MSFVQIEGVTKQFDGSAVLNDFQLNIEKGEFITLLGPSGCGKSTLLRCISGLTEFEAGRIVLDGEDITGQPAKNRGVGMVFQSYALFPNMSVFDNIGFGLKMNGSTKSVIARRVLEMLELVDLQDKKDAYPHQLSGGQQQRVALARSLAVQPKLLLLDEPLSALDARIRKNLRMELRQIQQRLQMTMIFVTHDQEEALMISDRICVMNEGRIVQTGTPEEIYTRPRTEFVARFIGNYNVLERARLEKLIVDFDGAAPETKEPDATFAIRPEAIRIFPGGWPREAAGDGWRLAGILSGVTVLGNVLRYAVDVDGQEFIVDVLNDKMLEWARIGAPVHLLIPHEECRALHKVV